MASFLDYYALSFNPFDKQCLKEKDGFMSSDFRQMTSRLEYLKNVRGIGVFTARPGMGKTFGLRCFAKSLVPNKDHMEYICLSTVSVAEFYRELCEILGVSLRGGKPGRFKAIQEQIEYLYREKRQPLILAVDEAQFLNTAILNDIRMIMNYGYDSLNCFTLILCGESHLNNTLRKPVHEALRQRITVHYDFAGCRRRAFDHHRSRDGFRQQPLPGQSAHHRQHHDGCPHDRGTDGPLRDRPGCYPFCCKQPESWMMLYVRLHSIMRPVFCCNVAG